MKRRVIVLVLVALMLAGCGPEGRALLQELAWSWAKEHAGDVARYTFTGRSNSAEVDAVLGARDAVQNMMNADQLMEEGRKENDLSKMEQAVEKRPGDYTYRASYGAALLRAGQGQEAEDQFVAADKAAERYGAGHRQQNAIAGIDELGAMRAGFEVNGFKNRSQCQAYYDQLAYLYDVRWQGTKQDFFFEQAAHYREMAAACE